MTSALRASFSKAAAGYGKHAMVQSAMAEWLAEWLPAERIGDALEVGAGTGIFTRLAQPWPGSYLASDLSALMCAQGRSAVPEVAWCTMAAEEPIAGAWDYIFSSSALQWTERSTEMLVRWKEVLRPGGRIVAGLFVDGSLAELGAVAPGVSPLAWRTSADWRKAMAVAGLRLVRDLVEPREFSYPNAANFFRSLHGVGAAPLRRLGPGALRRVMRDYESRYGGPGGVVATWVFYRFEAARE